jgi:hypothetical protein
MKPTRMLGVLPWLTCLCVLPAQAAGWDIDTLMRGLAKHEGGRARFVETKTIALLDKPVVSSGELNYVPPARLEKRTLKPKQELMVLDGDQLRGTLSGDKAALEKNYKLRLSGTEERWTLDLLPDDQRIAAFVVRITFGGSKNHVDWIRYLQADGDSAVMTIEQLDGK